MPINTLGEFKFHARAVKPSDSHNYVVYERAVRAHRDLYQPSNGSNLQCFHTMPLYERLCDKIDPEFRGFRVILGCNQRSQASRRE